MLKLPINVPIKNIGDQSKILNKIFKGIPKAILFGDSKQELCFSALNQFDFIPPLNNTVPDLEMGAGVVLDLLGLDADFFKDKSELTDQLSRFMYYFLELKDMPGHHLSILKSKVEQDLHAINRIIARDEGLTG